MDERICLLAREAYGVYVHTAQRLGIPHWEDLHPALQQAWREATQWIVDEACQVSTVMVTQEPHEHTEAIVDAVLTKIEQRQRIQASPMRMGLR